MADQKEFAERRRMARFCFACGSDNPGGMHLDIRLDGETAVVDFDAADVYQGFPGHMHGGILATVLDEVMAWAVYAAGSWAVTARAEIRYRDPVPLNGRLRGVGEVTRNRGRSFQARGRVEQPDGTVVAEATGIFMKVPPERLHEMDQLRIPPPPGG
ncbi:MAG: PaaI family thioesterase [Dehalococcoidia bacterium]|nr:PaaI family thioesterase [Dehalococcoidia bacterium]